MVPLKFLLVPFVLIRSLDFLLLVQTESSSDISMGLRLLQMSVSMWLSLFN